MIFSVFVLSCFYIPNGDFSGRYPPLFEKMFSSSVPMNFDEFDEPDPDGSSRSHPRSNAATGASAAGVRAISAQMVAFYFRAPVKAFFRARFEYKSSPRSCKQKIYTDISSAIWYFVFRLAQSGR